MRNQYKIENLPNLLDDKEAASKFYFDINLSGPSILKNTAYVDFKDRHLNKVTFYKVNSLPAVRKHITPKIYVDKAVDEISFKLDPDE